MYFASRWGNGTNMHTAMGSDSSTVVKQYLKLVTSDQTLLKEYPLWKSGVSYVFNALRLSLLSSLHH